MFVTQKHIPRRTVLRGLGAALALSPPDTFLPLSLRTLWSLGAGAVVVGVGVSMWPAQVLSAQATGGTAPVGRTSWGDPVLRGIWDFKTLTPLQRSAELADRAFLTDEEAAEFERQLLENHDSDRRDGPAIQDINRGYNQFWHDRGTNLTGDRRTSLIVALRTGGSPHLHLRQRRSFARRDDARSRSESCWVRRRSGPRTSGCRSDACWG